MKGYAIFFFIVFIAFLIPRYSSAQTISKEEIIYAWGNRKGTKRAWEKMKQGDQVIFYASKMRASNSSLRKTPDYKKSTPKTSNSSKKQHLNAPCTLF